MEPSTTERSAKSAKTPVQKLVLAVGMALSFASLIWALRGAELEKLPEEVGSMNWSWVAAAVVFDILVYFLQGWRWSLLLRPVANIPYARSIRAIYVGLFANEILPFRTGEIIRCYLQARWSGLPFTVILSSALIERIFDGIWLIACLIAASYLAPLPATYIAAGKGLAGLIAALGAVVACAMFFRTQTYAAFQNVAILRKFSVLLEDLYIIGHSRYLYVSALASLPYLLLQVLPTYALTQGYGLDITLAQAFVLTIILRFIAIVPQAPGNLGMYQLVSAITLTSLFGVDAGLAKRFSFVMWAAVTLPLLIAGFVALAITGVRLTELRQKAQQAQ